jgi:trehalose utilization protein
MTGPRIPLMHPHRRRARYLLPFAAAISLGSLACSGDQLTESQSTIQAGPAAAATGSHPRPRLSGSRPLSSSMQAAKPRATSFAVATAMSSTAQSVLILADADGPSTDALADTLTAAGFQVTIRPAPEYGWNGTDPILDGFDVVVHLNGSTYDGNFDQNAQATLSSFVENGGGYVGAQWNGAEFTPFMADLVLQGAGGMEDAQAMNCGFCQITYQTVVGQEGHPLLSGLPSSFTFTADGHDAGPEVAFTTNPSSIVMQTSSGRPAVLVRDFGTGKVVSFSFAPNYPFDDAGEPQTPATLHNGHIKGLYVNAVRWAAGSSAGEPQPQTITFDPIADKVYGNPAFSVNATASSSLPVSLSATGQCTVAGSTVTIAAAGACTITAQQAGNADYQPAEDVVRSFTILQATPTIQWTPASITAGAPLGDAQLNATAWGVGGVSLSGSFVYTPAAGTTFSAGTATLAVQFTPASQNYEAASKSVTIKVLSGLTFSGFFAPVRNMPAVNVLTAGSSVPMKFTVGGFAGMQILSAVASPSSVEVQCSSNATENSIRMGTLARSGLRSGGYSYTYVWKTNPAWAGTCRKFVLTLSDGTTHEALFRFPARVAVPAGAAARRIIGR